MENTAREWGAGLALCVVFFGFMWAYHDWWRGKTYTLATANEACALAGLYGIALAYALGPLYRLHCLGERAVRWRRPVGVAAVGFAFAHMVVPFFPLSHKYGWTYFSVHWITLALGVVAALWLLILAVLSFRRAAVNISMAAWNRIQQWGLVLLPVIVVHYTVLGKVSKWIEWFGGKDPHPGPPGTLIGAGVVLLVVLLRGVDWTLRTQAQTADGNDPLSSAMHAAPGVNAEPTRTGKPLEES